MWTEQDRVDALVWQAEEDDKLPCGHDKDEAFDPDNDPDLPGGYEVRRLQCHACKAIHNDVATLENRSSTDFLYFIPTLGGD